MSKNYSLRPQDGEAFGNTDNETDDLIMHIHESDDTPPLRTAEARYPAAVSVPVQLGEKMRVLLISDNNVRDIKSHLNANHGFIAFHFFVVFNVNADAESPEELREIKNDAAFFVWQRLKRAFRQACAAGEKTGKCDADLGN